jgi:PAS domain S-box-containing protein
MDEVLDFFRKLFDTADWPPRWHCGNWTEFHGWFFIISDLLVWSAYFAIPLIILRFISRKTDAKFVRAYFLFAAFILACGSTHLLDAITFWYPAYRLNALVKFITGVISWITVFYTIRILPQAMSLKSHQELEKEIKEKEKAESELRLANQHLNEAQDIARIGHWQWDVANDNLTWSENLYKMYGIDQSKPLAYEDFISKVHPDDRHFVNDAIQEAYRTKQFPSYIHRIIRDDGSVRVMQAKGEIILDENNSVKSMLGTGQDITEQHIARQELLEKTHELETANIELQKFAYVASHDLQEPLRKILTFASLLEKESNDVLPEKSRVYIEKIVSSCTRMQNLVEDILTFSNLKNIEGGFERTDLNTIIKNVLADMEVVIEQSHAKITIDNLPVADVIPSQIGQLFQNLISNAIKFKKPDQTPVVKITAEFIKAQQLTADPHFTAYINSVTINHRMWDKENFICISVRDEGVGFDPVYSDKIFEIFQRLQSKDQQGTGIGLAICKKIVDNHRGCIIAEATPGKGATFTIVLPASQRNFLQ